MPFLSGGLPRYLYLLCFILASKSFLNVSGPHINHSKFLYVWLLNDLSTSTIPSGLTDGVTIEIFIMLLYILLMSNQTSSITIECSDCEKEFTVIKSKKDERKYCSRTCYYRARKKGVYPPYWQGKKRDPETVEKQSKTMKRRYETGELSVWCEGKKLSEEHRKKLSEAKRDVYVGKKHPNWKGGKRKDERGYIRVWIEPRKWKYEHKIVMEKHLGRKLKKHEVVHHINKDTSDNRIENLMLFPNNTAHIKYHREVLGDSTINQYGGW